MRSLHFSDVPHLDAIASVLLLEGRVDWHTALAQEVVELRNSLPKGLAVRRNAQGDSGHDSVDLDVRVRAEDGLEGPRALISAGPHLVEVLHHVVMAPHGGPEDLERLTHDIAGHGFLVLPVLPVRDETLDIDELGREIALRGER
eukprot:2001443-Alexandrium_andersonii.AAC.1